ncbi:MAG: glycoside hydrolase [Chloroflexota bacterium]
MKVAYIGGGSAYAPGVVRAFIELPDVFAGSEIALMDLDAANLDVVRRLTTAMARSAGADLTITATTDRREALAGADFVLTSFRAGGFAARALDERIPLKYGVIGQETVGPGGFFFALRSMQVIRDLCAEMEDLCPSAWLMNYANPTNIIGEAVSCFSSVKVLALCDGGKHDAFHVAELLGYTAKEVEFFAYGLNHATWSTRFTIAGEDGIEMMDAAHDRIVADPNVGNTTKRMFRLARRYGRLPNYYMQYYYYPEETVKEASDAEMTRAEVIMSEIPRIFEHYREQAEAEHPRLLLQRGGTGFGEFAVDIIAAVATNSGRIEMINVPNRGVLPGLPAGRVAEVPCRLSNTGAAPLAQGEIPAELRGLILALAEYQSLTAEAGWYADSREGAVRALASNPIMWRLDADRVEAMYGELAQAHREWLPPQLV